MQKKNTIANVRRPKSANQYVDNKKFYEAIMAHREKVRQHLAEGKSEPKIPDYIGLCVMLIAQNLASKPCFSSYSFKEEMVSDAIENVFMYFNDFNPEKTQNAFAYFTQVTYYAFLRRIAREERNRYTTYRNFQETIINGGGGNLLIDREDNVLQPTSMYDNILTFMEKFEKKEEAKKLKRKEMKGLAQFYIDEEKKDD